MIDEEIKNELEYLRQKRSHHQLMIKKITLKIESLLLNIDIKRTHQIETITNWKKLIGMPIQNFVISKIHLSNKDIYLDALDAYKKINNKDMPVDLSIKLPNNIRSARSNFMWKKKGETK